MDPYYSIYEFLGRSAGSIHKDLGAVVYRTAKYKGVYVMVKKVKWSKENKGKIMTYPKSFLREAFQNNRKIKSLIGELSVIN